MRRAPLVLVLALAALAVTGCGGSDSGAPAVDGITEVTSLDQFREAFEADKGAPRLVLLLSPT